MTSDKIDQLKHYYENGDDNIGQDFVMPCLRECLKYRRGAGFFKSSSLIAYAEALYHVVKDNVQIEVLCSPALDRDHHLLDRQSENQTQEQKLNTINRLQEEIILKIFKYQQNPETHTKEKIDILAYLIASEQLKIKVAIRKNDGWPENMPTEEEIDKHSDLYHVKRGYFTFSNNEIIAFNGSFNETDNGHRRSYEDAYVHKNWEEHSKKIAETIIKKTDRDWEAGNPNLYVRTLSDDVIKKIRESAPPQGKLPNKKDKTKNAPIKIPININDESNIELWPHQVKAIKNWKDNKYKGIFTMATGSGKTITAISAIKEIRARDVGSFIVIVVPLRNLAKQWIKELEEFDFKPLGVSMDFPGWENKVVSENLDVSMNKNYKGPIIVAVEASFVADKFQNLLRNFDGDDDLDKLIIVDECHHFNKKDQLKNLPAFFNFRMGLSATPFNKFDIEKNEFNLLEYFDKEVIKYTLDEAINDGFLTPYNYHVVPVSLDSDEIETLIKITRDLAIALDNNDEEGFKKASGRKIRLLASVKDKLIQLKKLIKGKKRNYALAYCGAASDKDDEGEKRRIIEQVTRIFFDEDWQVGRITAAETMKEREEIISDLELKLKNVIVCIKVLDEGIDVPCCATAYILSSSRDDKQFIQRRGRVLRKHEASGKKLADIYDFAILGASSSVPSVDKLIQDEYYRINEFAKSALNKSDIYDKYQEELKDYD